MPLLPKDWNPLVFVFWPAIVTLPLWLFYGREGFGVVSIAVVLADVAFITLYLRQSRFAWHIAVALNVVLAVYHLFAGRHLRVDIVVSSVLLVYLFAARQSYFDYISLHGTQRI
jgi:hypothetical protein